MDENLLQYAQQEFNLPHDVVKLPSEGKFYKSKKKSVKVGYLTAADENIIMGSNTDDMIMTLVRSKLYEPDLKPDEMLNGDIEAILIFLRNTSFGPEYKINLVDNLSLGCVRRIYVHTKALTLYVLNTQFGAYQVL